MALTNPKHCFLALAKVELGDYFADGVVAYDIALIIKCKLVNKLFGASKIYVCFWLDGTPSTTFLNKSDFVKLNLCTLARERVAIYKQVDVPKAINPGIFLGIKKTIPLTKVEVYPNALLVHCFCIASALLLHCQLLTDNLLLLHTAG